jgi:hypothetical protein
MPLKHHPQALDASAEHAAHDHSESWSLPPMRLGISPPQREFSWLTLNLPRALEQEFRRDYARKSLSHFRLGIGMGRAPWGWAGLRLLAGEDLRRDADAAGYDQPQGVEHDLARCRLDQTHPRRAVRGLQNDGASSSSLSAATLRRLTRIIRSHQQRVVEFSTLPVRSRIHTELLRLARLSPPGPDRTSAVVSPAPTHAEIASRISTHREAVTRELNELARAKLVENRGGR